MMKTNFLPVLALAFAQSVSSALAGETPIWEITRPASDAELSELCEGITLGDTSNELKLVVTPSGDYPSYDSALERGSYPFEMLNCHFETVSPYDCERLGKYLEVGEIVFRIQKGPPSQSQLEAVRNVWSELGHVLDKHCPQLIG